jgi:hypothetical protein
LKPSKTGLDKNGAMPQRIALWTIGLVVGLATVSCADRGQATRRASVAPRGYATFICPTTTPNGQAPPGESRNPSDLRNGGLWTLIPVDGRLVVTMTRPPPPGTVLGELHRDGSLATKFPWWGATSTVRHLRITGRRLDGQAQRLRASVAPGLTRAPRFWASTITFTTQGCWKVTASAGTEKLTFVVQVMRG